MEDIRQYLLSVITSAIICAVVINIIGKKGALSSVIRLLTGLFLIYTVLSPWTNFRLDNLTSYFSDLELSASVAASDGKESAIQATASIIKSQVEAYILDKASLLDMDITVEVTVEGSSPPSPTYIKIKGAFSPYGKQRLEQIISDELGIPKENQSWT